MYSKRRGTVPLPHLPKKTFGGTLPRCSKKSTSSDSCRAELTNLSGVARPSCSRGANVCKRLPQQHERASCRQEVCEHLRIPRHMHHPLTNLPRRHKRHQRPCHGRATHKCLSAASQCPQCAQRSAPCPGPPISVHATASSPASARCITSLLHYRPHYHPHCAIPILNTILPSCLALDKVPSGTLPPVFL